MALHVYTSYLAKMANRLKDEDNEIYVQVSRSVFCPKVSESGVKVTEEIDENFGDFLGNYSDTLEDYYNNLDEEDMKWLYDWIKGIEKDVKKDEKELGEDIEFNIFLLCHENLEKPCKAFDKDVKSGVYNEGDYKMCHRRLIAKYMKEHFGMDIPEYDIQKENEKIVYREYF